MEWILLMVAIAFIAFIMFILFLIVKSEKKQRQFWEFFKMFIGYIATAYTLREMLRGQFDESKVPALLLSITSIMDSVYWFADRSKKKSNKSWRKTK